MTLRIPFVLERENGHLEEVVADQRDFAAYEAEYRSTVTEGQKETPYVVWRFLAYSVHKRRGETTTRAAWDADVVEVIPGRLADTEAADPDTDSDAGAPEGDPPVGPGRRVSGGVRRSSSPSRAARASSKS